jgi:hypothetical protein
MARQNRFLDSIFCFGLFLFFLPLMGFICAGLFIESGGPVLISQRHEGFGYSRLELFEFRTSGPTNDKARRVSDRKRFADFLYRSGLYTLPALANFAIGWGIAKSADQQWNALVLAKYFAQAVAGRCEPKSISRGQEQSFVVTTP